VVPSSSVFGVDPERSSVKRYATSPEKKIADEDG
jgi:hypothetical protein